MCARACQNEAEVPENGACTNMEGPESLLSQPVQLHLRLRLALILQVDLTSITFFCARPHGALYINLHLILRATLWARVVFLIVYPRGSLASQPPILYLYPPILVFPQGSRKHKHWSYPLLQERGIGDIALIDIGNGGGFPVFTHQFMAYGFLGDSEGAVVQAVSLGW